MGSPEPLKVSRERLEGNDLTAAWVVDQVGVLQALAVHPADHLDHLVDRVVRALIVSALEFGHVAGQMLGGHMLMYPRYRSDQNDSMPFVWIWPLTYSPMECLTASWFGRPT